MREETRQARKEQIEQVAYELLIEHGYDGTSMLKIAKRAKASNETLYRWYGDKQGLFKAMVDRNAQHVREFLDAELAIERMPLATIQALGPKLLELLVGPRAVALNRAAAADASGELGAAIAQAGRNTVLPLVVSVFEVAQKEGYVDATRSAEQVAEVYLNLLVGDLQIRRVIGVVPQMSKTDIMQRSDRSSEMLVKIFASTG